MVKYFAFCVKDSAMDAFIRPMFAPSRGLAIRSFTDEVNRKESEMNKHPADYDLYCVGTWDEKSGLFNVEVADDLAHPELVCRGVDVFIKG